MHELREHFKEKIEQKIVPFFKKYNFQYHVSIHQHSEIHDVFNFTRDDESFIYLYHMVFNPHDVPWLVSPLVGKLGFKKTTSEFDSVPLWYWKQKIAPFEKWQCEAIGLKFENYQINTKDQINYTIEQIIFDLTTFANDFLLGNYKRFDLIRQVKYLEYLLRTNVITETNWLGQNKDVMVHNKEVE